MPNLSMGPCSILTLPWLARIDLTIPLASKASPASPPINCSPVMVNPAAVLSTLNSISEPFSIFAICSGSSTRNIIVIPGMPSRSMGPCSILSLPSDILTCLTTPVASKRLDFIASRVIENPAAVLSTSKSISEPLSRPASWAGSSTRNIIVMPGMPRRSMGPCSTLILPSDNRTWRTTPLASNPPGIDSPFAPEPGRFDRRSSTELVGGSVSSELNVSSPRNLRFHESSVSSGTTSSGNKDS